MKRPNSSREAERAMQRHEEWMHLREIGIQKCQEKSIPLKEPPPPPPEPFQDDDFGEVSAEMIQQQENAEASESFGLDKSFDEYVPLADPEVEGAPRTPVVSTRQMDGSMICR
jgi:hypothetical protein